MDIQAYQFKYTNPNTAVQDSLLAAKLQEVGTATPLKDLYRKFPEVFNEGEHIDDTVN